MAPVLPPPSVPRPLDQLHDTLTRILDIWDLPPYRREVIACCLSQVERAQRLVQQALAAHEEEATSPGSPRARRLASL